MKLSRPRGSECHISQKTSSNCTISREIFPSRPLWPACGACLFRGLFQTSTLRWTQTRAHRVIPAPAKCTRSAAYRCSHCHAVPHPAACYRPQHPAPPLPWPGLHAWRRAPPSDLRTWGPNGPCASDVDEPADDAGAGSSLAEMGALVLSAADPVAKARLTHAAFSRWAAGLPVGQATAPDHPARPDKPLVVTQKEITTHKEMGVPLNAYMLHNLAHVELNAIDLAWDTVVRFAPLRDTLGDGFFADFARVADDESRHFRWYSQRLAELGFSYGDMPVHNLLWRECAKSSSDVSARLAVIPLVQEARGLDAGPRLVQRLFGFGDHRSADIVARVAEEELAHVSVGLYWFLKVCQMMGHEPGDTFKDLIKEYDVVLKGPFNYPARDEAGIPREWYDEKFKQEAAQKLSEVHDRLACIVEMEKENASLNG